MIRSPQLSTVLVVGPEWAETNQEKEKWTPAAEAIGKGLAVQYQVGYLLVDPCLGGNRTVSMSPAAKGALSAYNESTNTLGRCVAYCSRVVHESEPKWLSDMLTNYPETIDVGDSGCCRVGFPESLTVFLYSRHNGPDPLAIMFRGLAGIVIINGGRGVGNHLAIALTNYKLGVPVVCLKGSGGLSDHLLESNFIKEHLAILGTDLRTAHSADEVVEVLNR